MLKRAAGALALLCSVLVGLFAYGPTAGADYLIPTSVNDTCSVDVTATLEYDIALAHALGANTIDLQPGGCYLVSNSVPLTLNAESGLTLNGQGATLKQTAYPCGQSPQAVQPILTLTADVLDTFENLTLQGVQTCPGGGAEGDAAIYLGQANVGNNGIVFNHVNVLNVNGDGMDIYPNLCCGTGLNTSIFFENGSMNGIGYHAFVPEGVNGLTISGNQFSNMNNFMDLEVDWNCNIGTVNQCLVNGQPTGVAQDNISVANNTFGSGSSMDIFSNQGTCIPQNNFTIEFNTMTAASQGFVMEEGGSASNQCPQDSGLTIAFNNDVGVGYSPCGGSSATPPGCGAVEIADWVNVNIYGNILNFPSPPWIPCFTIYDSTATLQGNTCNNAWDLWDPYNWQWPAGGTYPTNVTVNP